MDTPFEHRPRLASWEPGDTRELPEHLLKAIQISGRYHEITIDPSGGQITDQLFIEGRYDSYSQVYELNGTRWKILSHTNLQGGTDRLHACLRQRRLSRRKWKQQTTSPASCKVRKVATLKIMNDSESEAAMGMTRSRWGCGERWIARMVCHPIPWRQGEEVTHHSASYEPSAEGLRNRC